MVQRLRHDRRLRFLAGLPPYGPTPSRSALVDSRRYLLEADAHRLAMEQQAAFILNPAVSGGRRCTEGPRGASR